MLLSSHRLVVRFRDCDALGHVNNAVYLTYLEQARFTLWKEQFGLQPGRDRKPGVIMARVEIDYRSQARYGDELDVRVTLDAIGRSSFTYSYEVLDTASGRLVAQAKTVQVHFDYEQNKAVRIDDDLRASLSRPVTR
jgi:acyl-CoA thioester hydrolase